MDDELQRFFGFRHPLGPVDDPAQLFRAASRAGLLSGIVNDVMDGPIVTSVRGGRGVGKSSFARMVAAELASRGLTVVPLGGASQSPLKIQRQLGEAFGIEAAATMKPDELLQVLRAKDGMEGIVLLFDDAEALSVAVFRYLQLLVNLFEFGATPLSIILVGGFGQWANLEQPDLEPMRTSTTSFNMLFSLREDEARAYLEHKFDLAGRDLREVFSRAAVTELLAQASGNSGQIDGLTRQALQHGFDNGHRRISQARMRRALPDTDGSEVSRGRLSRLAFNGALTSVALVAAVCAALFVWRDDWPTDGRQAVASVAGIDHPPAVEPAKPSEPPDKERPADPASPLPAAAATAQDARDPSPAISATAEPTGPDASPSLRSPDPPPVMPGDLVEHEPGPLTTEAPATAPEPEPPPPASNTTELAASGPTLAIPQPEPQAPMTAATQLERILAHPSAPPSSRRGGPGLVIVARGDDSMKTLYARVYRGMTPPPFATVLAANPEPVRPGALLIFPEPPDGWAPSRTRTP